jgi:hypothetical protein
MQDTSSSVKTREGKRESCKIQVRDVQVRYFSKDTSAIAKSFDAKVEIQVYRTLVQAMVTLRKQAHRQGGLNSQEGAEANSEG